MEKRSVLAVHQQLAARVEQVSIFLTADGTVITIFEKIGQALFEPILVRLHPSGTIPRSSNEASILPYAVLDATVDLALPIASAYDEEIRDLEFEVSSQSQDHSTNTIMCPPFRACPPRQYRQAHRWADQHTARSPAVYP